MNIPAPVASGSIPQVEDGVTVARFNDITQRVVEQFKTDRDAYGHPDDGTRFDFEFTLLDDERKPLLREDAEDPDQTIDLRNAKAVKKFSSDDRSNAYAYMKGILTAQEFNLWLASTAENPVDLSHVGGREVMVQISHNAKGWPQIEATLGPAKPLKGGK